MTQDSHGTNELLQKWQEMTTETVQAWAKAYGNGAAPEPLDAYRQMSETWLKAFSGAFKQQGAPSDPATFRKFMDESLDMWTKTLAEVMGGDEYASTLSRVLAQNLSLQGSVKQSLEPYMEETLKTFNLPSRKQVVALAQQLTNLENRLEGLEEQLEELHAALRQPRPTGASPGTTPRGRHKPAPS
ncbi:MAG: hypothetical protein EXR48_06255 [Dehalococcoidia bacterium]|nr:hypothetical protein [Dehalococcoidia bacterium]